MISSSVNPDLIVRMRISRLKNLVALRTNDPLMRSAKLVIVFYDQNISESCHTPV